MSRRRSLLLVALLLVLGTLAPVGVQAEVRPQADTPPEPTTRIVGGTTASDGEYPYQVAVLNRLRGGSIPTRPGLKGWCGGSVIHPRWVLTAAHCVDSDPLSAYAILAGTNDIFTGGDLVDPDQLIVHPGWNPVTNENDLALFHLPRPLTTSISPLVRGGLASLWSPGTPATVTGWGATAWLGPSSRYLLEVAVPIVADGTCTTNYPDVEDPHFEAASMVCAGYPAGGKDSCQGDSGGPLVVPGPGTHRYQVGIVSWGFYCAYPDLPGVYTRLASYFSWIEGKVGRPANDAFASPAIPACGVAALSDATQFATAEVSEPAHAGSAAGASLWYRFTPSASGVLHLNTLGSDYDTVLAAYTGASLPGLTPLAANDDRGSDIRSGVSLPVSAGVPYRIAVDGYATSPALAERGRARLNLSFAPDVGQQFPDVPRSSLFYDDIEWMANEGITTGFADCGFRPGDAVSRQSMAAFLYRLAGWDLAWHPDPGFTDVTGSHPFYAEIAWMVDEGITTGFPDGSYRTTSPVTRQSMAAFMYRLAGSPNGGDPTCGTAPFPDVPTSHPFCGEIAWMVGEGITTGFPDGGFHPAAAVSRQAMSAFMQRFAAV